MDERVSTVGTEAEVEDDEWDELDGCSSVVELVGRGLWSWINCGNNERKERKKRTEKKEAMDEEKKEETEEGTQEPGRKEKSKHESLNPITKRVMLKWTIK